MVFRGRFGKRIIKSEYKKISIDCRQRVEKKLITRGIV